MCGVWDSRPTGDKWLARYHAHGVAGLADLARRPHPQPYRTPDALVAALVAMKHRHPSVGPKKIRDRLRAVAPETAWPGDSTVGAILKQAGLVRPRRRRRVPAGPQALQSCPAVAPPAATLVAQQRRGMAVVQEYNWARSHEALARCPPGSVHQRSPRPYPVKLPPIDYAPGTLVRQVRHNGEVKWRGHMLYLSEVLAQEPVGFTPIGETTWAVPYSFHPLGTLDERTLTLTSARQWHHPEDPQAMYTMCPVYFVNHVRLAQRP